jgi:TP901 family phage tail tape measure protein
MNSMMQIGIALVAFDKMSRVIGDACGKATQQFSQLQEKIKQTSEKLAEIGTISYVGGQQILNAMQRPIAAFMELEDASTQLKSTLMQDGGEIPKVFQAIDKEAMELGNKLPGTTADFYKMASSLKALGVSGEAIAGGILKSAAYLGVVLKPLGVTYEQAAVATAKFKDAMGVAEKDMISFMDVIQRLAHIGVNVEEMSYAFPKVSAALKPLGIQGLEASKEIAPLIGMLIKTGIRGEEAGTGLRTMINQVMDMKKVGDANSMLARFGIHLDFVDQKTGKFMGIQNMIAQLDKLKGLSDVQKTAVFKELLGGGGDAALASIISSKGIQGYNDMVDAMLRQADLNRRVELSLDTLRNVWEAFTGTFKNTLAIIGESVAPTLKRLSDMLNTLSGRLGDFAKNHATLAKIFSLGGLAVGGTLVALGGLGIALSVILRMSTHAIIGITKFTKFIQIAIPWVRLKTMEIWRLIGMQKLMNYITYHGGFWKAMQYWLMTTRYRMLEVIASMRLWTAAQLTAFRTNFLTISGLQNMARAFGSTLLTGLRAAILGVRAFSIALLTTPIGWISLAIGASALLIITYWKPIKAFFGGLWKGIKEGLSPLLEIFKSVGSAISPLFSMFKPIITFIKDLIVPTDLLDSKLSTIANIGRIVGNVLAFAFTWPVYAIAGMVKAVIWVGKAIGNAAGWIVANWRKVLNIFLWTNPITMPMMALNKLVRFVFGINLFEAGKKILESLYQGMMSFINKPVEAIRGLAQKMRNLLPFSPAKEGPFKDLHRIKIIETIAETMKPAPMLTAMGSVMSKTKQMLQPIVQPVFQRLIVGQASRLSSPLLEPIKAIAQPIVQPVFQRLIVGQASRLSSPSAIKGSSTVKQSPAVSNSVTVNYNPTVNINGASLQAKEDFTAMLKKHQHELLKLIQDAQTKNMRLAY